MIRENATIHRGTASKGKTVVGSNNLLMENVHIAHDCEVGSGCIIGNSTKLAGEVVVDDCAIISACVLVHQFCHIGGYGMIQGGSRFSKDIPPISSWAASPQSTAALTLWDCAAAVSQTKPSGTYIMHTACFTTMATTYLPL